MNRALLIVDPQYDFIYGALGAPGRDKILPNIVEWASSPDIDVVIASRDLHPANHCSFTSEGGQWPKHCVNGMLGADIVEPIACLDPFVLTKGNVREPEQYSAFEGTVALGRIQLELHDFLYALMVKEVVVCGYCTDFCVKDTAIDSINFDYETLLATDAIAGVDTQASMESIAYMSTQGVGLTSLAMWPKVSW